MSNIYPYSSTIFSKDGSELQLYRIYTYGNYHHRYYCEGEQHRLFIIRVVFLKNTSINLEEKAIPQCAVSRSLVADKATNMFYRILFIRHSGSGNLVWRILSNILQSFQRSYKIPLKIFQYAFMKSFMPNILYKAYLYMWEYMNYNCFNQCSLQKSF